MKNIVVIIGAALYSCCALHAGPIQEEESTLSGWIELVKLSDGGAYLHVTIISGKNDSKIKMMDLYDPASSVDVKDVSTGKILGNFAGGGNPNNADKMITLPPEVAVTFAIGLPKNEVFIEKIAGHYELSLSGLEITPVTLQILKDGSLIQLTEDKK